MTLLVWRQPGSTWFRPRREKYLRPVESPQTRFCGGKSRSIGKSIEWACTTGKCLCHLNSNIHITDLRSSFSPLTVFWIFSFSSCALEAGFLKVDVCSFLQTKTRTQCSSHAVVSYSWNLLVARDTYPVSYLTFSKLNKTFEATVQVKTTLANNMHISQMSNKKSFHCWCDAAENHLPENLISSVIRCWGDRSIRCAIEKNAHN